MSTFSAVSRLAVAELIIYILFLPIAVFILIRHGRHGAIGWGFLVAFCLLRIIADGLQIDNQIKENNGESIDSTAAIVNSVGISPLLLALSGILSEEAHYALNLSRNAFLIQHAVFHVLVVTGIALAAIGGSKLAQPASPSNLYSKDTDHIETGYMILLLTIIILGIYVLYICHQLRRNSPVAGRPDEERLVSGTKLTNATLLVYLTLVAIVFAAVRVLYGVVYAFSSNKEELSPVTGSFAIKFLLIFGVQAVAASCLLVGGMISKKERIPGNTTVLREMGAWQQVPTDKSREEIV